MHTSPNKSWVLNLDFLSEYKGANERTTVYFVPLEYFALLTIYLYEEAAKLLLMGVIRESNFTFI